MQLTDVTVREGAQMPGRSYTADQRVTAGRRIDELGVAAIQTGFPRAGAVERETSRRLAETVAAETVAIARALPADVETAVETGVDTVEVFAPLSELHLEHDLGKSREEVFEMLRTAVDTAHAAGVDVRVSLLDAFRTDEAHIVDAFDRFGDVSLINLADTVGCRAPRTVRTRLETLATRADLGRTSVHFHDDLGVGVANALTAAECGVANADVSVGALGERAGNPALEELVVAGTLEYDDTFGIETNRLIPLATAVLEDLGEPIPDRKPILGTEPTRHEAGLHTAVMLEEPTAYEPFDPERFGGRRTLVFGSGTGRGGARKLLEQAGIESTDDRIERFRDRLAEEGPLDQDAAMELAERLF